MDYKFGVAFIAVRDKVIPLSWSVSDGIMISGVQGPGQSDLADYG